MSSGQIPAKPDVQGYQECYYGAFLKFATLVVVDVCPNPMMLSHPPPQRPEKTCLADAFTDLEAVLSSKSADRDRIAKRSAVGRVGAPSRRSVVDLYRGSEGLSEMGGQTCTHEINLTSQFVIAPLPHRLQGRPPLSAMCRNGETRAGCRNEHANPHDGQCMFGRYHCKIAREQIEQRIHWLPEEVRNRPSNVAHQRHRWLSRTGTYSTTAYCRRDPLRCPPLKKLPH